MSSQERIDLERKVNGCFEELKDPARFHRHSNILFKRCPCYFLDNNIHTLLDLNEYFKVHKTVPPTYMYYGEVSSRLSMAIKIVDGFILDKQAEEVKRQTEALKKGNNRG